MKHAGESDSDAVSYEESVRANVAAGRHVVVYDALETIHSLATAAGSELVVIVIPGLLDVPLTARGLEEYPYRDLHDLTCQQLQTRGVRCVDVLEAFAGAHLPDLTISWEQDRHFNDAGHERLAATMESVLREILGERT